MNTTFISIDWGGTHLKGAIIKKEEIINEFELPAGNLKVLKESDLLNICKNIINLVSMTIDEKDLCKSTTSRASINKDEIKWLIGAAGISDDSSPNNLKDCFHKVSNLNQDIEVYPDYLCNHAAFLGGEDGILSINGTGSIIFGIKGKKNIRLGGWGYIFDETPSGGYFGKKYLEAALIGFDGNKAYQYYIKDIKNNYNIISREDLLNKIYYSPSIQNYLGKFSKALTQAYEAKEPYAMEVINNSINQLSDSIKKMSDLLELKSTNICGSGGIWENWPLFKNLVEESCKNKNISLNYCEKKFPLYLGPLLYYKRLCRVSSID